MLCCFGALAIAAVFLAVSCSKSNSTGPGASTGDDFQTSEVNSRAVTLAANALLADSSTGLSFVFPEGAAGTLKTATIVSTVDAPAPGKGYYIEYDKTEKISLVFPDSAATILVYGYGPTSALLGDYTNSDHTWVSIPPRTLPDGKIAFDLLMPFDTAEKRSARPAPGYGGFTHYWVAKIGAGTTDDDKLLLYDMEADRMIQRYITELPAGMQAAAANNAENAMKWHISFGADTYNAFLAYTPLFTVNSYTINIGRSYTDPPEIEGHIAHESGHYLFHILAGNDNYMTVYSQMPWDSSRHGTGDVNTRSAMFIEEPAYFANYYQTGKVGVYADPTDPKSFIYSANIMPWKVDAPSIEGFGCAMLAGLHRTKTTITDLYSPNKIRFRTVPVIGASFTDIFGLLYQAPIPTSTDLLVTRIATYLASVNKGNLLIPFLHSIGWSYTLTGKLVDAAGKPLAGATVRNIYNDGVETWEGMSTLTPSAADGSFTIPYGVFGVMSVLRVYTGADSQDVDININLTSPTNVPVKQATITISKPPSTKTISMNMDKEIRLGAVDPKYDELIARVHTTVTATVIGYDIQQDDASFSVAIGMPSSVNISASATVEMVKSKFGDESYNVVYSYDESKVNIYSTNYSSATIKESGGVNSYSAELTFPVGYTGSINFNTTVALKGTKKTYNNGSLSYTLDADRAFAGPLVMLSYHQ
jgi:hypothetical protein